MGPGPFLHVVPLGLHTREVQTEFPNSWLLPVLKMNISHAPLQIFGETFVPLAQHLIGVSKKAEAGKEVIIATTYKTLYTQVWDLLPAFCNHATDIPSYFKKIARNFGNLITTDPDLRIVVYGALTNLIKTASNPAPIATFAGNFFPLLFNNFCSDDSSDNERARCLALIEAFAAITNKPNLVQLQTTVFGRLKEKMDQLAVAQGNEEGRGLIVAQQILMELGAVLATHSGDLTTLYNSYKPFMVGTNAPLQKKAFKAIANVCSSDNAGHKQFIAQMAADLKEVMESSIYSAVPATKYHRLVIIGHLIAYLDNASLADLIPKIIIEVITGTKEVNERARLVRHLRVPLLG